LRMFTTQDTRKQAVSRDEEERISRGWCCWWGWLVKMSMLPTVFPIYAENMMITKDTTNSLNLLNLLLSIWGLALVTHIMTFRIS
jgi:hypothetical protein